MATIDSLSTEIAWILFECPQLTQRDVANISAASPKMYRWLMAIPPGLRMKIIRKEFPEDFVVASILGCDEIDNNNVLRHLLAADSLLQSARNLAFTTRRDQEGIWTAWMKRRLTTIEWAESLEGFREATLRLHSFLRTSPSPSSLTLSPGVKISSHRVSQLRNVWGAHLLGLKGADIATTSVSMIDIYNEIVKQLYERIVGIGERFFKRHYSEALPAPNSSSMVQGAKYVTKIDQDEIDMILLLEEVMSDGWFGLSWQQHGKFINCIIHRGVGTMDSLLNGEDLECCNLLRTWFRKRGNLRQPTCTMIFSDGEKIPSASRPFIPDPTLDRVYMHSVRSFAAKPFEYRYVARRLSRGWVRIRVECKFGPVANWIHP